MRDEIEDAVVGEESADVVGLLLALGEHQADLEIVIEPRVVGDVFLEEFKHSSELLTGIHDDQGAVAALFVDQVALAMDEASPEEPYLVLERPKEAVFQENLPDVIKSDGEPYLVRSIQIGEDFLDEVRHTSES
jgi:hypothetical protein